MAESNLRTQSKLYSNYSCMGELILPFSDSLEKDTCFGGFRVVNLRMNTENKN